MVNIEFLNKYLIKKINQNVIISMHGIINFSIYIVKFNFEISNNKLKIKGENTNVLEIIFNEVREVQIVDNDDNILIKFNIDEMIIIKKQ